MRKCIVINDKMKNNIQKNLDIIDSKIIQKYLKIKCKIMLIYKKLNGQRIEYRKCVNE